MAGVILKDITKRFGEAEAVSSLSLEVEDGEMLVLVGPSGCGKSTTLRLIAGLEEPTEGEIWIGERRVNSLPSKDRDIAMVFQSYALYPHMTVYDNIAFGLKVRKLPKGEIARRVRQVAEMLGIADKLKAKPKELSGGQRQRVAVGRAIVRQPKVFLFDEPLSNLDAQLRVRMRAELQSLHQSLGTTAIYVTHDQVEAMTLGQRVAVLKSGRLQQVDVPRRLYDAPANVFVATFIGSPPMNLLRGTLSAESDRLWVKGVGFSFIVPEGKGDIASTRSGEVIVGVRPEHLQLAQPGGSEASSIFALVKVVEHLGAEQVVYGDVGGIEIVARLDPDFSIETGQVLHLSAQMDKLFFFDAESGMSL